MGAFDWLSQAGDWLKSRWSDDWKDFRSTFKDSWTGLPQSFMGIQAGLAGMATGPFKDDGDFWGSARLWADSTLGTLGGLGGGTLGTLFQVPILHEAGWLLDKAYRYGVARPYATQFILASNSARDAYHQGSMTPGTLFENMLNFNNYRRAWNDSRYVTPGQAIVYNGMQEYKKITDGMPEAMQWADEYDPRTQTGQAKFNSANAETLLKYGSGSLDFSGTFLADPAHGLGKVFKLGKLRMVDKVADARYVMAGKVHAEVGSTAFEKVRKVALASDSPEEFGQLTMPDNPKRGQIQSLLWSAARLDDQAYADAYLTIRAGDPAAYARLADRAPEIAASFGDMFANFTIKDMDYQRGRLSGLTPGADALQKTKFDAFIDSIAGKEGLWGKSLGLGVGAKMPRTSVLSDWRTGYHSFVLNSAPIIVGRPLANLMTSQGWTPLIDAMDGSAFSLRQFKANIERASTVDHQVLTPDEVNAWTSWYGAAGSDGVRHTIAMRVNDLVLSRTLERFGVSKDDLKDVLDEMNKWRTGIRKIVGYQKVYISEAAAKRAEVLAALGEQDAAANAMAFSDAFKAKVAAGEETDGYWLSTDVDGRLNVVPLNPVARDLPALRSQFGSAIMMLDYRSLRGGLRWWKLTHPDPKAPFWRTALGQVAKARGAYDAVIGAADSMSSMWKATALLRPAQAPRNVASDTLLSIAEFGKLPVLMATAHGFVNGFRNFGARGRLLADEVREARTRRMMDGTEHLDSSADVDISVPGNVQPKRKYLTLQAMFADGQLSFDAYRRLLEQEIRRPADMHYHKLNLQERMDARRREARAKAKGQQEPGAFVPSASRALVQENTAALERKQYIERLTSQGHSGDEASRMADVYFQHAGSRSSGPSVSGPRGSEPASASSVGPGSSFEDRARAAGLSEQQIVDALEAHRALTAADESEAEARARLAGEGEPSSSQGYSGEPIYGVGGRPGRESPSGWTERRFEAAEKAMTPEQAERARRGAENSYSVGEPVRHRSVVPTPFHDFPAGHPLFAARWRFGQYERGEITADELKMWLAHDAFTVAGKRTFLLRTWGQALVRDLVEKHLGRRQAEGYEDNPYAPGTLVVDPFTGVQPSIAMKDLREHFDITGEAALQTRNVPKKRPGSWMSVAQGDAYGQLKRFILLNADELTKPDTLLAVRVRPDGNIAAGFARAKPETIAAGHQIKIGAGERWKNFRYEGIKDMGHTGLSVNVGGKVVTLPGVFDDPSGQEYQRRVSARDNPATGFGALVRDVDVENLMEEPGTQKVLRADTDKDLYPRNWERDVNAQLASDPVARRFMTPNRDGTFPTLEQVEAEVSDTAWGTKWIHAMSFDGADYVGKIATVKAMVDTYLPIPVADELAVKAKALRVAASQKKATYGQLEDLYRNDEGLVDHSRMPEIHGASVLHLSGNSRAWQYLRHTVSKVQKIINDMPTDKWARFPFMAMAYQKHASELLQIANHYYGDADLIPAKVKYQIVDAAREKAYHDVRYRLYDTAQRNDVAAATRLLMPFSAAMMDSYVKYGRVIRQNPMLLVQGAYYWDAFEREGMVQDENGYVERVGPGGQHLWFAIDPKTGEQREVPTNKVGSQRYIQFQLPTELGRAVLGRQYYGVDVNPVVAINKETMNVFANLPSGGPLVAFSANEFALSHPDFAEDKFVKQYMLPYGPTSSRGKTFLPSTVRTAWDAFNAQDQDTAAGHAAAIMQAELIGYGTGTRTAPPTFEEVRAKANGLRFLRFMSSGLSPATFQVNSPYQPYIDSYRQMMAADPEHAAENFMNRNGDEFYAVMMSVTRNNAGVSATLKSSESYDHYKDLIQKYPEFGGLIVGRDNGGSFSKAVYEAQKETPVGPGDPRTLRELLSLKDSTEDLQRKATWTQYGRLMDAVTAALVDRGLRSVNDRGAEDLKAARDGFIEKNKMWDNPQTGTRDISPWYMDFADNNPAKLESKLQALQAIASDSSLQNRDDIRGLAQYLDARKKMQTLMSYWGYKSLDAQKSQGLKNTWQIRVHDLIEGNPAFADLWNRWLSTDDSLTVPAVSAWKDQPESVRNQLSIS